MRSILYIVILGLVFLAPVERADIAKLQPIEAVAISVEKGEVVLRTDTEDKGRGATAAKALEDLKNSTPAIVYLDTATFLLVDASAQAHVEEIKTYLKPSVKIGPYAGGDVKEEAKYLDVHTDTAKPAG